MNSLAYRLLYLFGFTPWDSRQVPPELLSAFKAGTLPDGPVLDLGCGMGTNVIYMAGQGREAYGIDFVPRAIKTARVRAREAGVSHKTFFICADVTNLAGMGLPGIGFALDMGCFQNLRQENRRKYISVLADRLIPNGKFMLYAFEPQGNSARDFGLSPDQAEVLFAPWFFIEKVEHGNFRGRGSNWFWMKKRG